MACIAKFASGNGGGCQAVGVGEISLRIIVNVMKVTSSQGPLSALMSLPETLGTAWTVKFALGNGGGGQAVELGDTCLKTHSECHECHLWPGVVAHVDIVPEILVIAWTVKFALGNGGGG